MKWLVREISLVTVVAALVLVLEPTWLAGVGRLWLVTLALLACGAILSEAFGHIPTKQAPVEANETRPLGDLRQMQHIEQANDFLLAVDYQLFPFLQGAVRDIATQRLLAHHNVIMDSDPDRARRLLGDQTWQLIKPTVAGDGQPQWGALSLAQLAAVADALEKV